MTKAPSEGRSRRMFMGSLAEPGKYKYQALVLLQGQMSGAICGGSVIDKEWVITAGSCIK